jgi:hypothetical protein
MPPDERSTIARVRTLGAFVVPVGGVAGAVVGVMVAGVLNSDCNSEFEAYWGCTHYNPGQLALLGAAVGAFLGIVAWGPLVRRRAGRR